jgi:hypothetical protein
MKLLLYTDLQATEGSERCRHDPSLPLQRYRVKKCYDDLLRIAEDHECTHLCDLGDTTDDRTFIYRATLDVVTDGLSTLTKKCPGFIKLTGNHEQLLKDGRISADGLFKPYFSHVGSGTVKRGKCAFVYASFVEDYAALNARLTDMAAALRKNDPSSKLVLFAHGDVKGARYASGESCSDGISLVTLDLFDASFLGHVHVHQCLIKGKSWFIGSPFQQDFGEANQPKQVAIFDTDTLSVDFIPMTAFPEYRTLSFKDFLETAKPTEEHRYWVQISSIEETEQFYAHPLSELGEAKLTYSEKRKPVEGSSGEFVEDPKKLLERFVRERPLVGLPEELSHSEIVDLAMSFVWED